MDYRVQQEAAAATGSGLGGGQPQPDSPAALARASTSQQASIPAGAGPQQEADSAAWPIGRLKQTPVSGKSSSTRAAALTSPVS
jgi:hypothetical protein